MRTFRLMLLLGLWSTGCGRVLVNQAFVAPLDGLDGGGDVETDVPLRDLAETSTPVDASDDVTELSDTTDDVGADAVDASADATAGCANDAACAATPVGPCQVARCEAGACVVGSVADGVPCGTAQCLQIGDQPVLEGLLCTGGTCGAAVTQLSCWDSIACTQDGCDAKAGCTHTPKATLCGPAVGDAANPCQAFTCDATSGCTLQPGASVCDDGSDCTSGDHCQGILCVGVGGCACKVAGDCGAMPCRTVTCGDAGTCVYEPASGGPCDDGDACTLEDTCTAGSCAGGKATVCDDGIACTLDLCLPMQGCVHAGDSLQCGDGDPCTVDVCDAQGGCTHTSGGTGGCDDGDACTSGDACKGGKCLGVAKTCASPGACQTASCDAATGLCKPGSAADGSACDDGNACSTQDACQAGVCVGQKNPCDDGNGCTFDACNADGSCQHEAKPAPCDLDGSVCTEDLCAEGVCKPGAAKPCDDKNVCTTDSCNAKSGCVSKAVALGVPCGAGVWCAAGKCVAVPVPAGMVYVAAATFTQGCNAAVDSQCKSDELPAHAVSLGSYFMGKTEATAGAFAACVQAGACTPPQSGSATDATFGAAGKEQFPVNYVTYAQAQAFCTWSGGARLCSEAEWEFAARGTDGRRFPWGNGLPTCEFANFSGCADKSPHAVGSSAKGGSSSGTVDMAGNVREWVADWYGATSYTEAAKSNPAVNPTGAASGSGRVLRGGYFLDNAAEIRTSARSFATPAAAAPSVGIRCCKGP